jgi:hypothetical protein
VRRSGGSREGTKEGRRGLRSHVGGAGHHQEGGASFKGGDEPQAEPPGAQGKGVLCEHLIRPHGSGRRVLHSGTGGKKHLTFSGGDVGGRTPTTR